MAVIKPEKFTKALKTRRKIDVQVSPEMERLIESSAETETTSGRLPPATPEGREALRKRAVASFFELRAVIFEAERLTHDFINADNLSPEARAIVTDASAIVERVRDLISRQV